MRQRQTDRQTNRDRQTLPPQYVFFASAFPTFFVDALICDHFLPSSFCPNFSTLLYTGSRCQLPLHTSKTDSGTVMTIFDNFYNSFNRPIKLSLIFFVPNETDQIMSRIVEIVYSLDFELSFSVEGFDTSFKSPQGGTIITRQIFLTLIQNYSINRFGLFPIFCSIL